MLQDGIVPIGPPIANTQFHVLDSQQNQVPIGVPGELHIGGIGLSPGYWKRDYLTAERFVANPLVQNSKFKIQNSKLDSSTHPPIHPSTLYKTGDRVRLREDGTLEYLGRLDHQVKLRGFRIELGEIEAVLTQHPDVSQAVVALREDKLVAYVVLAEGDQVSGTRYQVSGTRFQDLPDTRYPIPDTPFPLRQHLSAHLPPYMVPSQFVVLDALPLTPNGKVDRKALPRPESTETAQTSTTPRTLTEELLANIWSAVLSQDSIGRHDNFFELGGHSLLATRVVAQVAGAIALRAPHPGSTCDRN